MKHIYKIIGLPIVAACGIYFYMAVMALEFTPLSINYHTYETDDQLFYNGEVLIPDMVHQDTLVVIDAPMLNEMIIEDKYLVASDGEIYDLLQEGCVNAADYQDYMNTVIK